MTTPMYDRCTCVDGRIGLCGYCMNKIATPNESLPDPSAAELSVPTSPMDTPQAGWVVQHRSGAPRTLQRRKDDGSGWWLEEGGGIADSVLADEGEWSLHPPLAAQPWRVGRQIGRTIYADDVLIGVMDTRALAEAAVEAHNHRIGDAEVPDATRVESGRNPAEDPNESSPS